MLLKVEDPMRQIKKDVNLICNALFFIKRKILEANKEVTLINSESKYTAVCYVFPCRFLYLGLFQNKLDLKKKPGRI